MKIKIDYPNKITEMHIQSTWNCIPRGSRFSSQDGNDVVVVFQGRWNQEAGPDFKNARLEINGSLVNGDIEIHKDASEWYLHKHEADQRYANVILHVVTSYDITTAPKLETIILPYTLSQKDSAIKCGACAQIYEKLSIELVNRFFCDAGQERCINNSKEFTEQIMKMGAEYTFYKAIFRTLGYKNNTDNFAELFERFWNYSEEERNLYAAALLWGESSLLPDTTQEKLSQKMHQFCMKMWEEWGNIRPRHQYPMQFIRSGNRPYNTPERRIAAAARLMQNRDLFTDSIRIIRTEQLPANKKITLLCKLFQCRHSLWNNHTSFNKEIKSAALIGRSRALTILINAVFPVVYAYSLVKQDQALRDRCIEIWFKHISSSSNATVKYALQLWIQDDQKRALLNSNSLAQQGLLHIYKTFCHPIQSDCSRCPIVLS